MRNRPYLVMLALLACGAGEQLPDPSFTLPAALVIQDAETDGRGEARIGSASGPLFVDVNSFDRLGRVASGGGTTAAALRKAVGKSLADSTREQVVRCSTKPEDPCLVVEQGIFIQLDSRLGSDHSAICRRQRLLRLRPADSGWFIQARQLMSTC